MYQPHRGRAVTDGGRSHFAVKFVEGVSGRMDNPGACGSGKDPAADLIEDMRCGIRIRRPCLVPARRGNDRGCRRAGGFYA